MERASSAAPRTRYVFARTFEEIILFIISSLATTDECYRIAIHAAADFNKINQEPEQLHGNIYPPFTATRDSTIDWNAIEQFITDPEAFSKYVGSGFALNLNSHIFYAHMIIFNPTNEAEETRENVENEGPNHRQIDSIKYAIAMFYARKHYPNGKNADRKRISFIRDTLNKWDYQRVITTMTNLHGWHEAEARFNIDVYNQHGLRIYSKQEEETAERIPLLWKDNKFKLIKVFESLFNLDKHKPNFYCDKCQAFVQNHPKCHETEYVLPKDKFVKVAKKHNNRFKLAIYADLEAIVTKENENQQREHKTSGYSYLVINDGAIFNAGTASYGQSVNLIEDFISDIKNAIAQYCDFGLGEQTKTCPWCNDKIGKDTVQAKSPCTGIVGTYHPHCWLQNDNKIPIYFHNLKGYDSHFILNYLISKDYDISIMGKSKEKFDVIAINKIKLNVVFKDTLNYLLAPLAQLALNIKDHKFGGQVTKEPFPYEWFDDFDKLNDEELPQNRQDWYSSLTNTYGDLETANKIWNEKGFMFFSDYHNYYMMNDVLILAEAFEQFRDATLNIFKIDPIFFQGAPSLSWYIATKGQPENFQLIPDVEKYINFHKNGIRGGVAQCCKRYAKTETDEYLIYLDINALYSYCMSKDLPSKYIGRAEQNFDTIPETYFQFICCDITYPQELHDLHYNMPLAPHHFNNRLCTTFLDKYNYFVSKPALDFYQEHGLIVTKIHYIDLFEKQPLLRDFVIKNIEMRKTASSTAEKDLCKLMNNSVYGKTCENVLKRSHYGIYPSNEKQSWGLKNGIRLHRAQNFQTFPFTDKVILAEMKLLEVELNKPVQIGAAVLDYAKIEIYNMLLNMTEEFGENCELCYTDTDSLLFHIKCSENPYVVMGRNDKIRAVLDFEDAPENFPIHTIDTQKVMGLWSDEAGYKKIIEFVGLRAKCYALKFENDSTLCKNKGIRKSAHIGDEKRTMDFDDYVKCLRTEEKLYVNQGVIQSKKHVVTSRIQKKLALNSEDMKRIVCANDVSRTVPIGYKGERWLPYLSEQQIRDMQAVEDEYDNAEI